MGENDIQKLTGCDLIWLLKTFTFIPCIFVEKVLHLLFIKWLLITSQVFLIVGHSPSTLESLNDKLRNNYGPSLASLFGLDNNTKNLRELRQPQETLFPKY